MREDTHQSHTNAGAFFVSTATFVVLSATSSPPPVERLLQLGVPRSSIMIHQGHCRKEWPNGPNLLFTLNRLQLQVPALVQGLTSRVDCNPRERSCPNDEQFARKQACIGVDTLDAMLQVLDRSDAQLVFFFEDDVYVSDAFLQNAQRAIGSLHPNWDYFSANTLRRVGTTLLTLPLSYCPPPALDSRQKTRDALVKARRVWAGLRNESRSCFVAPAELYMFPRKQCPLGQLPHNVWTSAFALRRDSLQRLIFGPRGLNATTQLLGTARRGGGVHFDVRLLRAIADSGMSAYGVRSAPSHGCYSVNRASASKVLPPINPCSWATTQYGDYTSKTCLSPMTIHDAF